MHSEFANSACPKHHYFKKQMYQVFYRFLLITSFKILFLQKVTKDYKYHVLAGRRIYHILLK